MLRLQRVVGNRAVSGMLGGGTIQRVPYAVAYSEGKTKGILNASEGRASPSNGAIGHPRQHVGRWEKAEHFAEEQGKTKSVYSSTQEQDKAIASGLSSVAGQAVLAQLDAAPAVATRRTIPNVATDAVDVKVVKAKKKAGTGTVKSWDYKSGTATVATIAVDSMGTGTTGDIHIQTAYPVLD